MRAARTVPAALAAALAAATLTGCTPDGPTEQAPPLDEALTTYADLYDDVLAALREAPDARDLTWAESLAAYPSVAEQEDGLCYLFVTSANGTGTIDDAQSVLAALATQVDPVLEEHGMEPMSEQQHSEHGGEIWVESVAANGAGARRCRLSRTGRSHRSPHDRGATLKTCTSACSNLGHWCA